MAGQDQSVNLGGMLGQIAETTGSMGDAYKPVMQQATKPRGDMDDPSHLNNLAQWASRNGDAQSASMYMQQAQQLRAEKKRTADATLMNGATATYRAARESGDATKIQEAEQALIDASNATGADAHARLDAVQMSLSRAEEAAYVQGERQKAAEETAALQAFTKELNAVTDPDAIQAIVDEADPKVAPIAQRAATARLAYLDAKQAREEKDAESTRELVVGLTIPEGLPAKVTAQLKAELANVEAQAKDGFVGGTWTTPTGRREAAKAREVLAQKIWQATYSQDMTDYQADTARMRDFNGKKSRVAISTPTTKQALQIKKELIQKAKEADYDKRKADGDYFPGFFAESGDISVEDVNNEFRRQQMVSLTAEYDDILNPGKDEADPAETEELGTAGNPIPIP